MPSRHIIMGTAAVIDRYIRYVLSWRLPNTLEEHFCLEALDEAFSLSRPEIFNTNQDSEFTAREYTRCLEEAGIAVSQDGRGRA
ncbi:MAG: hypothetical protein JO114_17875 [Planctomycetaceae bacterium]|nr:hypothetical protein [Planctomycetaceae bacterium]